MLVYFFSVGSAACFVALLLTVFQCSCKNRISRNDDLETSNLDVGCLLFQVRSGMPPLNEETASFLSLPFSKAALFLAAETTFLCSTHFYSSRNHFNANVGKRRNLLLKTYHWTLAWLDGWNIGEGHLSQLLLHSLLPSRHPDSLAWDP